jgi:hypothetical protein
MGYFVNREVHAMTKHHLFRIGRRAAPVALVCAGVLGVSTAASAGLSTGTLVQAPDHPFAGTSTACDNLVAQQTALGSTNYPNAEVEPSVVVDPTNPMHLVASFQQDRWNDGGANGEITDVSTDGGKTWNLASTQPAFTVCQGATSSSTSFFNRASDPWLSYSKDGTTVYQASLAFNANGPAFGGASSVQVSTSTNGGVNWNAPVAVRVDPSFTVLNDKEAVTADPLNDSVAYTVWDRLVSPSVNANPTAFAVTPAFRGPVWFAKTTDGGKTWGPSKMIFDPGQKNQTIDNQIVVEPAGTAKGALVDFFVLINTKGGKGNNRSETLSVAAIRSTDGGTTWSAPVIISPLVDAPVTIDGAAVRTGDSTPSFAADPSTGNLYAVWQDGSFSPTGQAKIAFSESSDGGLHWSTPIRIDQSPGNTPAFTPQVSVNSAGTIGVSYYDFEKATAAQPGLTDAFIATCPATSDCTKAASWAAGGETRLSTSGSFDMTTAPNAEGFFVGDYEGLTATGATFAPFFVMAKPIATNGSTDPFANTAG